MAKRFITAEDVALAGRGPLLVDDNTVVTPQALLAAQAAGIQIQTGSGAGYSEPAPDRGPDAPVALDHLGRMPEPDSDLANGNGAVVTVVGKNRPGILAEITSALGESGASVVDNLPAHGRRFFSLGSHCGVARGNGLCGAQGSPFVHGRQGRLFGALHA